MTNTLYFYEFSRREVESVDLSRFLRFFKPTDKQKRKRIQKMMGRVMFAVGGYDEDPNELYSIPEVRAFFQAIRKTWPCWLYFSEVDSSALRMIAFCTLSSLSARKVAGASESQVAFDRLEMMEFLLQGVEALESLARFARLSDADVAKRTDELMAYFGLK